MAACVLAVLWTVVLFLWYGYETRESDDALVRACSCPPCVSAHLRLSPPDLPAYLPALPHIALPTPPPPPPPAPSRPVSCLNAAGPP